MESEAVRHGQKLHALLEHYGNFEDGLRRLADARTDLFSKHSGDDEQSRVAQAKYYADARLTCDSIASWVIGIKRCYQLVRSKYPNRFGEDEAIATFDIWPPESGYDPSEIADMCERAKNCLNHLLKISELENPETEQHLDPPDIAQPQQSTNAPSGTPDLSTAPLPGPAPSWQEITITFLSDERVTIERIGNEPETRNYGEMGFEDKRGGKPRAAWIDLREMSGRKGEPWPMDKKRAETIRSLLQMHFSIDSDPLTCHKRVGYSTRFQLLRSGSFNS